MAPRNTGIIVGAVAAAGVAAAALAGVSLRLPVAAAENAKPKAVRTANGPTVPPGAPLSFADIFDRVSPAVVSINVTTKIDRRSIPGFENFPFDIQPRGGQGGRGQGGRGGQGGGGSGPGGGDDEQNPGGGNGRGGGDDDQNTAMASGSGFFISSD